MSTSQIAERLGVSQSYIKKLFSQLRTTGMECITAAEDRLDSEAVPLAVEKLILGLQSGDKDYVLETLKGRHRLLTTQPLPAQTPEGQMCRFGSKPLTVSPLPRPRDRLWGRRTISTRSKVCQPSQRSKE